MIINNKLLFEYKEYLINKDFSISTVQNYTSDVEQFINFIKMNNGSGIVNENEITLKIIECYKQYLTKQKTPKNSIYYTKQPTISRSTIQGKLNSIKSFIKYINNIHDCGIDYRKIETKKYKTDYIETITPDEFNLFMNYIKDNEKYKINGLRSMLLVNIGYTSGLRISEILSLKRQDIENKEARIIGKGKKARRVYFTNSSVELLKEYMKEREQPIPRTGIIERPTDNVFISHNSGYDYGNPISKETFCAKIKKYSDDMNNKGIIDKRITAHCLRHSYATRLLEAGLNIREIQELLGHSDIQTTQNYLHVLKSNLQQKVNNIFE